MRSLPAIPKQAPAAAAILLAAAPLIAAQPGQAGTAAGLTRILIPVAALIVLAVLGGLGVLAVRRRMLAKDTAADQGGLLDDLRAMRDRGQITPEEFDAARKSIAAKMTGRAAAPARAKPPNPGNP